MQNHIDVTLENFQQVMLEDSKQKLVMVEFWANGYDPSEQMAPLLSNIASQHSANLLHARVNCQEQAQIAAQFGVQALPTVILVKEGQPIDGFTGPQDEAQIKQTLEKHLPKPEDDFYQRAKELVAESDYQQAFPLLKQANELAPERSDIKCLLADCYIELGQIKPAKTLLESIGQIDQDSYYQSLLGKIDLAEQAADSPEIKALQEQVEANPDDLQLKISLAIQLQQANQVEEALDLLFRVLTLDIDFGEAKKTTLDMINALPDGDPIKSKSRRRIYSLLY
jgi:putative thioredoxin